MSSAANDIEHYDILVFGGGKAGKTLAMQQARAGRRVALVEAGMIGGSCINVACIPTKTLVRSAQVAHLVRHAEDFGSVVATAGIDMPRIAARTAGVVAGMVADHKRLFAESGLALVLGWGRFVAPRIVEVATEHGTRRVTGDRIYLNLGTRAAIPPIPGLHEAAPLTHVEALLLETVPERLLILGGGYIGMELAQAFRRLGSEVTIVEHGDRPVSREDPDVSSALQALLQAEGIRFEFGADARRVSGRSGEAVVLEIADGRRLEGSHLLVAAGRTPMTSDIGLDIAGVTLDPRGYIVTDDRLATSAPDIWALGEVAGSPMFTHVAFDDYRIARSGIEESGSGRTRVGRLIPNVVFVDPEFARVGLSETEARLQNIAYVLRTLPMRAVPRARTLSEETGFMKALVSPDDGRILGFAMLGAGAGEVMSVVQMAMLGGLPHTALRDAILAHPTLSEGLNVLFAG